MTGDPLREIIQRLLLGIDQWADDQDGVPECAWDAYEAARAAIGHPLVIATVNGWEGRYQALQGALNGDPWPPVEEDEPADLVLYQPTGEGPGARAAGVSGYVQAEGENG